MIEIEPHADDAPLSASDGQGKVEPSGRRGTVTRAAAMPRAVGATVPSATAEGRRG